MDHLIPEKPWFHEGLRFQCTACGDCCTGAPGFVWVNREEIELLCGALGLSAAEFERLYVREVGIRKSLLERADGDCVFFDPQRRQCQVYDARPRQCQTWPFWQSNLRSSQTWRQTCEACPGCGRGRRFSLDEIQEQVARRRV